MKKATVSRTINPLHFEDLEPHRFEDLIRQLAHGFRNWINLEATGRLGKDDGLDIRGVEGVTHRAYLSAGDASGDAEESPMEAVTEERIWSIQCKRHKRITPGLMRTIVGESVPDLKQPPYGLVIAAACDVSAETMAAFHDERVKRGVAEGHLWTKAHIEDLLFRPDYDHLLFAYFGISLGTKRRSRLQQIQSALTIKRKILRALGGESVAGLTHGDLLLRDVEDTKYPFQEKVPNINDLHFPPWFPVSVVCPYSQGVMVCRYTYDGWLKPDGTWDLLLDAEHNGSLMGLEFIQSSRTQEEWEREHERWERIRGFYNQAPETERVDIQVLRLLPFTNVLEVDNIGDNFYEGPHLYCRWDIRNGPFETNEVYFNVQRNRFQHRQMLGHEHYRPLFRALAEQQEGEGYKPTRFSMPLVRTKI